MAKQTQDSSTSQAQRSLWFAVLMATLALFVHGYLYAQHLAIDAGEYSKSICDINEKFDCSAVAASRYAVIQGLPVALLGLWANLGFLILAAVYFFADPDKRAPARRNLLIASLAIFAGSVVMGFISLVLLSKFCLFCMAAYVLSILLLVFTWLAIKDQPWKVGGGFTSLLVTGVVAILGAVILNSNLQAPGGASSPEAQAAFAQYVGAWQTAAPKTFTLVDPLTTGPEASKAKMTIVEFADYRCSHCKHAAPVLHAFVTSHPDVRLEFQPWPLDGECNSSLNQANGASCLLARASWCAEKNKQSGWKVHDYVFGLSEIYPNADAVKADLGSIAQAAGLTPEELRACTESDAAKTAVRAQADVGTSINLEGTPTIYVNKKILQGGQVPQVLQKAYDAL